MLKQTADLQSCEEQTLWVFAPPVLDWDHLLNKIKATPHDCVTAHLINHLSLHLLLKLNPKVFKHLGQQESVPEIMRSGGVCDMNNVLDQEGWKVDLLASVMRSVRH